jgi:hypothetical protein
MRISDFAGEVFREVNREQNFRDRSSDRLPSTDIDRQDVVESFSSRNMWVSLARAGFEVAVSKLPSDRKRVLRSASYFEVGFSARVRNPMTF